MRTVIAVLIMFMGTVGTAAAQSAKLTQQEKMKLCNQQAKEKQLKGDERKAFMSSCLRSDKKK